MPLLPLQRNLAHELVFSPLDIYISKTTPFHSNQLQSSLHPFISSVFSEHSLQSPQQTMLSTRRFMEMAKKWKRIAALRRRRITMVNNKGSAVSNQCSSSSIASKGYVYVYTHDRKRFMIPLAYLTSNIFVELLKKAEEEFGLPSDRPITLPCDADCMEYILSMVKSGQRNATASNVNSQCRMSSLLSQGIKQHQMVFCGF